MNAMYLGLLALLSGADSALAQTDLEILIARTLRPSVVKIDVSSNTPAFDKDGNNICQSQGTGFAINRNTIVTADHVLGVSPDCGSLVIVVRSKRYSFETLATKLASEDDVVLLRLQDNLPQQICAARLRNKDSYNEKGFRLGIPATLNEANVLPVTTGDANHPDFGPHVTLTPSATEGGESGGPIVVNFSVVGILRQKHRQYTALAIMTSGAILRGLVQKNRIPFDSNGCDPSLVDVFDVNSRDAKGIIKINPALGPDLQVQLGNKLNETYDNYLNNGFVIASKNRINVQSDQTSISVQTTFSRPSGLPTMLGTRPPAGTKAESRYILENGLQNAKITFERDLWQKLATDAEQRGLWTASKTGQQGG